MNVNQRRFSNSIQLNRKHTDSSSQVVSYLYRKFRQIIREHQFSPLLNGLQLLSLMRSYAQNSSSFVRVKTSLYLSRYLLHLKLFGCVTLGRKISFLVPCLRIVSAREREQVEKSLSRVHLSFVNISSGKLTLEISTAKRKDRCNTLNIPLCT